MVRPGEAHDLRVGEVFGFTPDTQSCQVDATAIIDYYGESLFLYRSNDGLHGHLSDHTPVWILE